MNVAMLLAGGIGKRLGADKPKQFVEILNKPMIIYALEIYQNSKLIDAIEIVCVREYIDYVWELAKKYEITKLKWVCEGGKSCQDSTRNGIFYLKNHLKDDDIVTINMSSSLFVSNEILEDSINTAKKYGNAFACMPCVFNNAETEDGICSRKINRKEKNRTLNMPWTTTFGKLNDLYHKAYEEKIEIDESSYMPTLFLAYKEPLYFSKDDGLNKIHIQREADIEIATAILEYRNRHKD